MKTCACGKELTGTSTDCWMSCTILGEKVIEGICIHGVCFPRNWGEGREDFEEDR